MDASAGGRGLRVGAAVGTGNRADPEIDNNGPRITLAYDVAHPAREHAKKSGGPVGCWKR